MKTKYKTVITYGTFDLFHIGHLRLLQRSKKYGDAAEQQQNVETAAATSKELADNYNKAFSACLEGKGYTVK